MTWTRLHRPSKKQLTEMDGLLKPRGRKARLLVDENLGVVVPKALRKHGCNAKAAAELGLEGRDDSEVYAFARKDLRMLITCDRDFLDNRKFPLQGHPGVIVLPDPKGSEDALSRTLARALLLVADLPAFFINTKLEISQGGDQAVMTSYDHTGRLVRTRYRFNRGGDVYEWEG